MNKDDLLQKCCAVIEQKLGWGCSDDWQNQDFEALSALIYTNTHVVLSVSTLKRVWGKVKYDNAPSSTTLNTLAVFAGYAHWRDFKLQQTGLGLKQESTPVSAPVTAPTPVPVEQTGNEYKAPATRRRWQVGLFIVSGVLALILITSWIYQKADKRSVVVDAGHYSFTSQPLATGLPNSVIFHYDVTAAKDDSVFIQQSWDPKRRFRVPAGRHTYTSIYYYPGFFKAKLIVGNKIVKEHDLLIPSNGWVVAADQLPVPVYFSLKDVIQNGVLHLPAALMERNHIPLQPNAPEVRFCNIGDLSGLQNDNFVFETTLKSDYSQGAAICQRVRIVIHCENAAIIIPLGIPGCVGEMGLLIGDKYVTAQEANLSGFGCNMNEWVKVRCEARDKHVQIWINDKMAYSDSLSSDANKIIGISYRFEGPGAVDAVKFARLDGSIVLEDTFTR